MSTVYSFFVIDCAKLERPMSIDAMHDACVAWEAVESRMYDGFDDIDEAFGRKVTGEQYGAFSRTATSTLAENLRSVTPDVLAKIEADELLSAFYWAMRKTAEEAAGRKLCLSVRYTADPEEQEVQAREEAERERLEDEEAAGVWVGHAHLPMALEIVRRLMLGDGIRVAVRGSQERIAKDLADQIARREGDAGTPASLSKWFAEHDDVEAVLISDEAFAQAVAAAQRSVRPRST